MYCSSALVVYGEDHAYMSFFRCHGNGRRNMDIRRDIEVVVVIGVRIRRVTHASFIQLPLPLV